MTSKLATIAAFSPDHAPPLAAAPPRAAVVPGPRALRAAFYLQVSIAVFFLAGLVGIGQVPNIGEPELGGRGDEDLLLRRSGRRGLGR